MIDRQIATAARALARQYPIVVITGPRQSGKTTLARQVFPTHPYVLLESPDQRRRVSEDPRGFLAAHPDGAVLDEVQRVPELLSYLQGTVDEDQRPGRFILTGSQQFGLLAGITQSLAGRAAMLELLPFSTAELSVGNWGRANLAQSLWRGSYPPIHDRGSRSAPWFRNYVTTYVERDVRQLVNVRDLLSFETFLRMCAARCGQLVESVRPRLRLRYLSQHRARMAVGARSQLYRPAPTAPLSQLLQAAHQVSQALLPRLGTRGLAPGDPDRRSTRRTPDARAALRDLGLQRVAEGRRQPR